MRTKEAPVEIKGQKEGLWIFLRDQIPLDEVLMALEQKLASSNNFFSGAEVMIDTGTRVFSQRDEERLRELIEQKYTLRIKEITQSERRRMENHETTGASESTGTELHFEKETGEPDIDDEFMKFLDETFRIPVKQSWKHQQTFSSDYLYENEEKAFYFRGTVRSGQLLEFPGNIVILGDVNPGAYVIASGDIIVMGRLNGVVHAGAEGNEQAVVIGASFTPSQLRIAQYIGRPPDESPQSSINRPRTEKAYIKDGVIVIEPIL